MKRVRLRLTLAEIDILQAVIGFAQAGETDGGPLAGETDAETRRNIRTLNDAADKLAEEAAYLRDRKPPRSVAPNVPNV